MADELTPYGLVPLDHGGLYGLGETLTYASQRLLTRHSLAREFPRNRISPRPFSNELVSWASATPRLARAPASPEDYVRLLPATPPPPPGASPVALAPLPQPDWPSADWQTPATIHSTGYSATSTCDRPPRGRKCPNFPYSHSWIQVIWTSVATTQTFGLSESDGPGIYFFAAIMQGNKTDVESKVSRTRSDTCVLLCGFDWPAESPASSSFPCLA